MALQCEVMAGSSLLPNSLCSRTPMLLISGLCASTLKARYTRQAVPPEKYFGLTRTPSLRSYSTLLTFQRRPSPLIQKAHSMWALLRTARCTRFRLPARSPYFSIRRQNTFGTWRSAPMARCTLPQGIKDSFSPLPLTARANCFIPATKPTFASSHSMRTKISSPGPS